METKESMKFKFTSKRPVDEKQKESMKFKFTPKPKNQKRPFDAEENQKEFYQSLNELRDYNDRQVKKQRLCEEELKKEKEEKTEVLRDMDKLLRSTNNMISAKSMISTGTNTINRELKNLKALNEKYAITDEEDI